MWQLYCFDLHGKAGQAALVVDDDCLPCYFGADIQDAATWLAAVGQRSVLVMTQAGLEECEVVKRDPAPLSRYTIPLPQAMLIPVSEANRPVRTTIEALAWIGRYQHRRLGQSKRRHRDRLGPSKLLTIKRDVPRLPHQGPVLYPDHPE